MIGEVTFSGRYNIEDQHLGCYNDIVMCLPFQYVCQPPDESPTDNNEAAVRVWELTMYDYLFH